MNEEIKEKIINSIKHYSKISKEKDIDLKERIKGLRIALRHIQNDETP